MKEIPFAPAIYEHKAALLLLPPYPVSRHPVLLRQVLETENEIYRPDYLTVGLDIYNLELEAMGGTVEDCGNLCPEISRMPTAIPLIEQIFGAGRFKMMLDVASQIKSCGPQIRIAATGPVTLAAKFLGSEQLLMDLILDEGLGGTVLTQMARITGHWCEIINRHGFDAIVFDSMAAPPLCSPDLYRDKILPLHRDLMQGLASRGQTERELVIGGDTTAIAPLLKETGANILLCDFAADPAAWKKQLGDDTNFQVRRNLNPAAIDQLDPAAFRAELELFNRPIFGTGILPYEFDPAKLLSFRERFEKTGAN
ncbi:MAG: uroporphyrinogen decarboxylase family protein [Victivallaceae bacterium]